MSDQFNLWGSTQAPFSQEAEEAALGAILAYPIAYFGVAAFLKTDDFFIVRHRYIWEAMGRLHERSEPIEYVTVREELENMGRLSEIGGPAYLTQLINNTPSAVHAEVYARLVERAATRRRLMSASDEIKALALDENLTLEQVIADAEARLFDVTERQLNRQLIPMHKAVNDYFDRIEHLMHNRGEALGVPTGFKDLDKLLGGMQKSDLLIFAGRPGMGKCLAAGTLIPTERGIVPIESLKPSDVSGIPDDEGGIFYPLQLGVQTPNGFRTTSHFYDSGLKPTLKVQTRAGYSITGTYVHPVLTRARPSKEVWKSLANLGRGDTIAVQRNHLFSTDIPEIGWDEVVSVEDAGIQHCYDLTIPDGHAFVANGIVNHNTSFMLSAALNMARLGQRIAIFSMEMGVDQIVQRLVSMESAINSQNLRIGQLSQTEYGRFVKAAGNLARLSIYIDDTPAMSPIQMRTKCLRMQREHGVDMVVVDYMQLMNAGGAYENNRVQEISFISRSMKEMARELNVPVLSAAQLSRAVEQRQDKRPLLSDLRESGCLAGDTLIHLPDSGQYVPIRDLVGKVGFRVTSLNTETWKLEPGEVTNSFCTGVKPVYRLTTQLGRSIRATANHKFLTINGWKRLDELSTDDHIALPRRLDSPSTQTMTNSELALLGHLIGDGCTLPRHSIQYTTRELDLAETVAQLANDVFGGRIKTRIHKEPGRSWYQVFLSSAQHLTHGVQSPVRVWLDQLGVFGLRSHEKRIPDKVFAQSQDAIALFLRHLWATDGSIRMKKTTKGIYPSIYYASSSEKLAQNVQALLLHLQINARLKVLSQIGKGRDQHHVIVTGAEDLQRFVDCVGAVGVYKQHSLEEAVEYLQSHPANTNRDIIPNKVWRLYAVPAMQAQGITSRVMQAELGNAYCGTGLYKQNVSRDRAAKLAQVVKSEPISYLAESDVYWDAIVSIEPDGEVDVYDLTVPKFSNFIANGVVAHNSIEQDADVVMFLYRDEIYNEATEFPNQADIIIAKHRNGPTGTISLFFEKTLTKFMNAAERSVDLSHI
ncbi:MAG: replicative DNA helicase [Anaerolineae bacterium]|nr:replicative DNA helicase [Anaerolineae bacterium]